LIGVGIAELGDAAAADPTSLFDPQARQIAEVEHAIEAIRAKLGDDAIGKGRGLFAGAMPPRKPNSAS
jgi:DNA polymerase-4